MKLQSPTQRHVKGRVLGGPCYLVCLPLAAHTLKEIVEQATQISSLDPDLVEWRVDGYEAVHNIDQVLVALDHLRRQLPD